MWEIEEYAISGRIWVWLIPANVPVILFIIAKVEINGCVHMYVA